MNSLSSLSLRYNYDALPNKKWSLFSMPWICFDSGTCFGFKNAIAWRWASSEFRTLQTLHALPLSLSLNPATAMCTISGWLLEDKRSCGTKANLDQPFLSQTGSWLLVFEWDQKKSTAEFSPNCQPTELCIM